MRAVSHRCDRAPPPFGFDSDARHILLFLYGSEVDVHVAAQIEWVSALPRDLPLIVLLHHYPREAPELQWTPTGALRRMVHEVRIPMSIPAHQRERFWAAAAAARVRLVLCGHVHRARLEWHDDIAIGLNGQSGADWAGRTIAWYDLSTETVTMSVSGAGPRQE